MILADVVKFRAAYYSTIMSVVRIEEHFTKREEGATYSEVQAVEDLQSFPGGTILS